MPAPIVPYLLDMMADRLTVRRYASSTGAGTRSYGVTVSDIPCKISEGGNHEVRDSAGNVRTSHVKAIIGGVYDLDVRDEFTLPSRFKPTIRPAIMVKKISDENGPHHEVVYF